MSAGEPREPVPVEFDGRTGEWFGIWIVNLALTVVTLGIYSAWAKVRRQKYFYQHTRIAGRSFDYHATGKQILIGRIIVLAGLIGYSLLSSIPVLAVIMPLLFVAALPVLLVRSMRFNAAMSSWSNVRFRFDGRVGRAFLVYLVFPLLALLPLGLAWPFATRANRRYTIGNHRLGTAPFSFSSGIGPFYRAFVAAILWVVVVAGLMIALVAVPMVARVEPGSEAWAVVASLVPTAILILALLPAAAIYGAFLRNPVFAATRIDGVHRLQSDISPLRYIWIILSNAAVVVVSLGLMLPWAQIRVARYLAAHTAVVPGGSLDEFADDQQAKVGAWGDAFTDIEGWDVGLPV